MINLHDMWGATTTPCYLGQRHITLILVSEVKLRRFASPQHV